MQVVDLKVLGAVLEKLSGEDADGLISEEHTLLVITRTWYFQFLLSMLLTEGHTPETKLEMQEFMILPVGAKSFKEAMKMGVEVYHNLKVFPSKQYFHLMPNHRQQHQL